MIPVNAGLPMIMRPPAKNEHMTRLELAEWLTGERNTLTDRVLANRLWAELFGIGIVETLEDFGSSGLLPTNQPLLDHLALRLSKDHHWHLKPFLREIVLSAAYRQQDKASPELLVKDPRNRFIARGPRQRPRLLQALTQLHVDAIQLRRHVLHVPIGQLVSDWVVHVQQRELRAEALSDVGGKPRGFGRARREIGGHQELLESHAVSRMERAINALE